VRNGGQRGTVQFNICNIAKPRNLYSQGMTPFSRVGGPEGAGEQPWRQGQAYDVQFVERLCSYSGEMSNQLRFKFDFPKEHMEVALAYALPYSYSQLHTFIDSVRSHPLLKVAPLCESLGGL
jgi:hypothetical protein